MSPDVMNAGSFAVLRDDRKTKFYKEVTKKLSNRLHVGFVDVPGR
jgi:hypothetical protein